MSEPRLLSAGWAKVKEYAPAVIAAALMYAALYQMISTVADPVSALLLGLINAIIGKAFPDKPLLSGRSLLYMPWEFEARRFAVGIIVLVVGMFFGLFANARSGREPAP